MSYLRAENVLPKELIEHIQQYVSGASIYIPSREKKDWGSQTSAKTYYQQRNEEIHRKHQAGCSVKTLAAAYSLTEKSIQRILRSAEGNERGNTHPMDTYEYITLLERPEFKETAAGWFHSKWGVPKEAYLACMEACLNRETDYDWYLCLYRGEIVAGLGVIENDFHDRKDLTPNICAVYTEEAHRKKGLAGNLLNMAVAHLKAKGISPVYLVTDHVGFYERYGWKFLTMAQGDGEPEMTRLYLHD